MNKSLDRKLAAIHADPHGSREFILCDAKDQDMAFGLAAPGAYRSHESPSHAFPYRSREEFLNQIRAIVAQGVVDIVLMSASNAERLCIEEKLFEGSRVTPAARANDTTDIWVATGASYPRAASRPFRSATLDQIQCGRIECSPEERRLGPDLGLYSITFVNERDRDLEALERYKEFRLEAERVGFRHFLELFDPNISGTIAPGDVARFINDQVARTLAAAPARSRPIFLKTVFHGPRHMEELVHYDPHLIVGVLGGGAGTTFDAFDLLYQAKKAGARAALFGRKINGAEHQTAFVKFLRLLADGEILPAEAVRAYHDVLGRLGIRPLRALEEDLKPTVDLMAGEEKSGAAVVMPDFGYAGGSGGASGAGAGTFSYGGGASASGERSSVAAASGAPPSGAMPSAPAPPASSFDEPEPDFATMTVEEKLAWNQRRRDRMFG